MELAESQRNILRHINEGGLISISIHGKRTKTVMIHCLPKCDDAGIMIVEKLLEAGLVRYGDPSPYLSGISTPIILTDAGRAETEEKK